MSSRRKQFRSAQKMTRVPLRSSRTALKVRGVVTVDGKRTSNGSAIVHAAGVIALGQSECENAFHILGGPPSRAQKVCVVEPECLLINVKINAQHNQNNCALKPSQ